MNEYQYFQVRTMIEQNALRKMLPVVLTTFLFCLLGMATLTFGGIYCFVLKLIPLEQTVPIVVLGLIFCLLASAFEICSGKKIRDKKEKQLKELNRINKLKNEGSKEYLFFLNEDMMEYFSEKDI